MAHTQISPPNTRILHKGLGSHKEWLIKRMLKEHANGQELATHERGGGVPFYRNLEKLAVGAVRADRLDRSTILVRPV
jgi:hypothetical protein